MTDQGFPLISYTPNSSPEKWGQRHGEEFRQGIKELCEIRRALMLERAPHLKPLLKELSLKQWQCSKDYAAEIMDELEGIRQGADVSLEDIVILNNYTDFRDIGPVDEAYNADEGCSTLWVKGPQGPIAGQTWDMHGSARNYVCVIEIPPQGQLPAQRVFSLVGCVGMMGFNQEGAMIGVNNLNTQGASAALIWPVFVRRQLQYTKLKDMEGDLGSAKFTSGHTYLLADSEKGAMWEALPHVREKVQKEQEKLFHTNHCLATNTKKLEMNTVIASTTALRFELIKKKIKKVQTLDEAYGLLTDHENYPRSICSHFQSGSQDPSMTCGGALAELKTGRMLFWRGCPEKDDNYREHRYE